MLDAISEPLFDAISIVLTFELCMLGLMVAPLPSLVRGPLVTIGPLAISSDHRRTRGPPILARSRALGVRHEPPLTVP